MTTSVKAQSIWGDVAPTFPLPDELLVCALEFLSLPHLRSAAGVSRQFYGAAWRSGLYMHIKMDPILDPRNSDHVDRDAESWNALVGHALRKDLRVAISLRAVRAYGAAPADTLPLVHKLLVAITRSLPILVSLSILIEPIAYPDLCAALRQPAPCLRSLYMHSSSLRNIPIGPIGPSDGLFAGGAPFLRELGLKWRSLGPYPLPVFANVIRFQTWNCDKGHPVSLARHFPRLIHFMFSGSRDDVNDQVPPPQVHLRGLNLRSLVFKDTTSQYGLHAERSLTTTRIAVFHSLVGHERRIEGDTPLGWRACTVAMHVSETAGRAQNVRVAPSDGSGRWRRSYIIAEPSDRTALYGRPAVAAQIGYLRLGNAALADFVACTVRFAALRRLRVDIQLSAPSVRLLDGEGSAAVQCPVLETVALLSPEQYAFLATQSVISLGRALRSHAKPTLELSDVDLEHPLAPPEDGAALDDVFSVILRVPYTVINQFDSDEWNDNLALAEDRYLLQTLAW